MTNTDRRVERVISTALVIIATTCVVAALYATKPVIVPLILAMVIALCLAPAVDGLVRLRVPRTLAAALVLGCVLMTITAVIDATWMPARSWLWGTLAALLNFVPYFGPLCMLVILTVVGLVNLSAMAPVLMLGGGFMIVTFVEGQLIQPLMVGRRLQLNPIAVLLGMWLLWALWGVAGVVLAVPILLTIKVLAARVEALRGLQPFIAVILMRRAGPRVAAHTPPAPAVPPALV